MCVYVCVHVCLCVCVHVCMHACVCVSDYVYVCVGICLCLFPYLCLYLYLCLYRCLYLYLCMPVSVSDFLFPFSPHTTQQITAYKLHSWHIQLRSNVTTVRLSPLCVENKTYRMSMEDNVYSTFLSSAFLLLVCLLSFNSLIFWRLFVC